MSSKSSGAPGRRARRVLVVDDEELMREAAAALLAEEGYSVREARDGAEALASARAERPDVILTDIMMPLHDGLELLHGLRASEELMRIPVVVMTASCPTLLEGHQVAVLLLKPFTCDALLAAIARALEPDPSGRPRGKD